VEGEAISLTNIGNACNSLGQYKEALDNFIQSLEINRRLGHAVGEAGILTILVLSITALVNTKRLWIITRSLLK
jgi:tetratricopeptide (TPR) repeat protein